MSQPNPNPQDPRLTVAEARDRALKAADAIQFEGKQYRKDIAWQAVGEKAALG